MGLGDVLFPGPFCRLGIIRMQEMPTSNEKQQATPVDKQIPMLKGAAYYLAVPAQGMPWQMAIYNQAKDEWRVTDANELFVLAQQMGMQPQTPVMAPQQQYPATQQYNPYKRNW
jgi:hypothetical protein